MIIFKYKNYSSAAAKTSYVLQRGAQKLGTAIKSGMLELSQAGKKIVGKGQLGDQLANKAVLGTPKNTISLKRKAVQHGQLVRSIKYATPGENLKKGASIIAKNPVGSLTYLATAMAPVPSAMIAPMAERAATKIPGYAKLAKATGELVTNGVIGDAIQHGGDMLVKYLS